MKTYRHSESVPPGVYLATNRLDLTVVTDGQDILDGVDDARYVRLPAAVVFLVSPVVGGIFVLAFPVLIFAAAAWALWRIAGRKLAAYAERHAHLAASPGVPAVSYLDRKDLRDGVANDEADELEDLRAEVAERRREERDRS